MVHRSLDTGEATWRPKVVRTATKGQTSKNLHGHGHRSLRIPHVFCQPEKPTCIAPSVGSFPAPLAKSQIVFVKSVMITSCWRRSIRISTYSVLGCIRLSGIDEGLKAIILLAHRCNSIVEQPVGFAFDHT
jgi:hypothetical protein